MPNSLGFRGGISAKKRKTDGENPVRSGRNTAFRKADSRLEGAHLYSINFGIVQAPSGNVLLGVSGRRLYCVTHSINDAASGLGARIYCAAYSIRCGAHGELGAGRTGILHGRTARAYFGAALLGGGGAIRNCPITLLGKCTNVLTVHSSASSRENYVTHDGEKLV